jgi:hypothetical protein
MMPCSVGGETLVVFVESQASHMLEEFNMRLACCVIQEQKNMHVLHFRYAVESR